MKRNCKKCFIEKKETDFYANRHECKSCLKLRTKIWAKNNPERRLEIVKNSRASSRVWKDYSNEWKRKSGDVAKRRASIEKRTPAWLTEDDCWMMRQAYELCAMRSDITGIKHHVDHIIPLRGKIVSGLHVPFNLQVVPAAFNLKKGNR